MLKRLRLSFKAAETVLRLSDASKCTGPYHPTPVRPAPLPEWHSPAEHATRLFEWLQDIGLVNGTILAAELTELHEVMCQELGWLDRHWYKVARAYSLISAGGAKRYVRVGRRRMRVHTLPSSIEPKATTQSACDSRNARYVAA
jgi:hypothetical protein